MVKWYCLILHFCSFLFLSARQGVYHTSVKLYNLLYFTYSAHTSGVFGFLFCFLFFSHKQHKSFFFLFLNISNLVVFFLSNSHFFFFFLLNKIKKYHVGQRLPSYLQKNISIFFFSFLFTCDTKTLNVPYYNFNPLFFFNINLRYRNLNWHFNPVIYNQRGIGQTFKQLPSLNEMKSCSPVSKNTPASVLNHFSGEN